MRGVSIVTAAFRAENLQRVWESITAQVHTNWEWIVVNDGQEGVRNWMSDAQETGRFTGKDINFVDMWRRRAKFGLYSRNLGAMIARHDRLVFLDDDNEWTPNHISSLVTAEESAGFIPFSDMRVVGKKPDSTFDRVKLCDMAKQNIDLGCLLWRKEFFAKYGYFIDERSHKITFDWELMRKIMEGEGVGNFVPTREATFIFHHGGH